MAIASNDDSRWSAWIGYAFATTTLAGAFLLFQVEPLIGKFILPWFGGAPAVWTTCLVFFQLALFAGYAFSHWLVVRFSPRAQAIVETALVLAAMAVLPIAPGEIWKPSGDTSPSARILLLLTAVVGLPYFVLSTTSPLIQSWFSRVFPGRAPYRLYALSNVGSLAALLSYPFVFEPAFALKAQAAVWSWCFVAYALLMGTCAIVFARCSPRFLRERARLRADHAAAEVERVPRRDVSSPSAFVPEVEQRHAAPLGWQRRALWLFLPACASVVLLATTNHVCQDVAPRPFLWVMPLALYLLSFIVCFDRPRWYVRPVWAVPAVVGIAAALGSEKMLGWNADPYQHVRTSFTFSDQLVLHFGTMFCIAMVCHGELARLKPEPRRLTEFYLYVAAGGALGGLFVGLVAPYVFGTFREWNLGMAAAYVIATAVLFLAVPKTGRGRTPALLLAGFALGGLLVVLLAETDTSAASSAKTRFVDRLRNFYGVVSVWELDRDDPAADRLCMRHGAILHGEQFLDAEKRDRAFNYYAAESGIARTIRALQARKPSLRVGVAGLGIGTLAAFARPGDRFAFYEINPVVPQMAEEYFSYLNDARQRGANVDVILGDARLALERQPPQEFDLLVLDAFSGDSVPVHLLTREAMDIYRRHVAENGVIAIHVTNSYLYLFPVARALAEDAGLGWRRVYTSEDQAKFRTRSNWLIASSDQSLLRGVPNIPPPSEFKDDFLVTVWTDQKNDQFAILMGRR